MIKYVTIIVIVILGLTSFRLLTSPKLIEIELPLEQDFSNFEELSVEADEDIEEFNIISEPQILGTKIEDSINLAMPFSPQAPTANWDQPWQDACEEASLLIVDYYYQGKDFPAKTAVEDIIIDMVVWQEEKWGGHYDLSLADVAIIAQEKLFYRTEIVEDLDAAKIKEYLRRGLPLIVPADGRILDNPFFSNDGPDYHMLVIKGYKDGYFITNDPGTRRGEDFIYTEDNLLAAIFDWDDVSHSATGPKRALVLHK